MKEEVPAIPPTVADTPSPDIDQASRQGRSADRLSITTKLGYGLGEMAEGVKTAPLETFFCFYYVQIIGLQGSLVGLALLNALLFDGISDPLIGQLSDRTATRFDRRHPYLYLAPIPVSYTHLDVYKRQFKHCTWAVCGWRFGWDYPLV